MDKCVTQYTLHLGDCLKVMSLIPSGSIDLILCDLPYGTTACAWDVVIPFEPLWGEYKRMIKQNGAIVLFGSQPFTTALINSNRAWFRYELVWEKSKATGFLDAKRQPLKAHENLLVFAPGRTTYNPQKSKGAAYNKGLRKQQSEGDIYARFNRAIIAQPSGDRFPRSVIYFPTAESEGDVFHKTQKPVRLAKYLIRTYSNEGATVLDNCMGSGTTGVAAVQLSRKFIGIEKEPRYFEVAQYRLKEAVGAQRRIEMPSAFQL